jgi:hypothetical protein
MKIAIFRYFLVGGFNHLENISQWEGLSHILWKIKNETTNQFFAIENSWLMKIDIFSHEE